MKTSRVRCRLRRGGASAADLVLHVRRFGTLVRQGEAPRTPAGGGGEVLAVRGRTPRRRGGRRRTKRYALSVSRVKQVLKERLLGGLT